jgi:hypothetical protein
MSDAYDDVFKRIQESGTDKMDLAIKILSWLFYAKEPLTMRELQEALVIEEDDDELQRDYMLESEVITDCCKSLVIYDTSSGFIRFAHYTVQEFISTVKSRLCPVEYLAKTCLDYLSMRVFNKPCHNYNALCHRIEEYAFSRHAGKHWGFYVAGDPERFHDIQLAVFRLLLFQNRRCSLLQLLMGFDSVPRDETFLHLIARVGLATICRLILDVDKVENAKYVAERE